MTTTETTMSLARDERRDLADFLATLAPELHTRSEPIAPCTFWA